MMKNVEASIARVKSSQLVSREKNFSKEKGIVGVVGVVSPSCGSYRSGAKIRLLKVVEFNVCSTADDLNEFSRLPTLVQWDIARERSQGRHRDVLSPVKDKNDKNEDLEDFGSSKKGKKVLTTRADRGASSGVNEWAFEMLETSRSSWAIGLSSENNFSGNLLAQQKPNESEDLTCAWHSDGTLWVNGEKVGEGFGTQLLPLSKHSVVFLKKMSVLGGLGEGRSSAQNLKMPREYSYYLSFPILLPFIHSRATASLGSLSYSMLPVRQLRSMAMSHFSFLLFLLCIFVWFSVSAASSGPHKQHVGEGKYYVFFEDINHGRFGNQLIAFVFSYHLGHHLGATVALGAKEYEYFKHYPMIMNKTVRVEDVESVPHEYRINPRHVSCSAPYFQNYAELRDLRNNAKKLFRPNEAVQAEVVGFNLTNRDVVIHYRNLVEEKHQNPPENLPVPFSFFDRILSQQRRENSLGRVLIMVEDEWLNHSTIQQLQKHYHTELLGNTTLAVQFSLARSAHTFIGSFGTLSWAIAYLSTGAIIHLPYISTKQEGCGWFPMYKLFIHDDDRIRYHDLIESTQSFFQEASQVIGAKSAFSRGILERPTCTWQLLKFIGQHLSHK